MRPPRYFTTSIAVGRSLEQIRNLIQEVGAEKFLPFENFAEGVIGVRFIFGGIPFELTISVRRVQDALEGTKRIKKQHRNFDHALKIAYRLLLNWLDNNFELCRWGVARPEEVFLAHAVALVDGEPTKFGDYALPKIRARALPVGED